VPEQSFSDSLTQPVQKCINTLIAQYQFATEFATVGKLSFSAKRLQAGSLCQEKK
jgi:hypothetical protein